MKVHEQIRFGSLKAAPPLVLAPMAGLTHSALRTLVLSFGGVGLLTTEMLSARRLPCENMKVSPYLVRTGPEYPLIHQLFVTDERELAPAIDALHRFRADGIDLNLGCPAPSVRRAGGGSSLMEDRDRVCKIVRRARALTPLPLSAKIRLGTSPDPGFLEDFVVMLEDEGLDLLTVHARLIGESFARPPRWERIAPLRQRLSIPVIANGSIDSVKAARACLAASDADGLMIGRAAVVRPWVLAEIAREIYGANLPAPRINLPDIYLRFVLALERFRPERRLGRLKEFTQYFSRNYPFGHRLASVVQSSVNFAGAWEGAVDFFRRNDPDADLAPLERWRPPID